VDFERVGRKDGNVYELVDGSVLRAKLEITGILRTDKYGPDGDPLYIINNQPIQRMKVAESLIKKQRFLKRIRAAKTSTARPLFRPIPACRRSMEVRIVPIVEPCLSGNDSR